MNFICGRWLKGASLTVSYRRFLATISSDRRFLLRSLGTGTRSHILFRSIAGERMSGIPPRDPLPDSKPPGIERRYDNIIKSAEDTRNYRGIVFSNGLRIMLVSDSKADKSAASMDVNVGHLMDPWNLPGTAHFCEHMLFLGTDKYPSENDYSKFIMSHGGSTNAFTGSDHTNYHFDIAPEFLPEALDHFIQFFLSPQFTESATEREVLAVDSENSNNLQNDQWRMIQLERSLSKPGHDYGKFGTGSKKTLIDDAREKGIEPREALLKFHQEYYSSDIMTCSIVDTRSLDELENLVVSLGFGSIKKKGVSRKVWTDGPYGEDQMRCRIELVPVKDLRYLTLIFPIGDYKSDYRTQPIHYVSHLIGHEGPGSLLSELKRRGWVSSLSAGGRLLARGFGLYSISVDLSEDGLKHTHDIIRLIYHEIGLVKSEPPLKWVQEELRQLAQTKFRFKDKETAINYATFISSELQRIPFKDVLCSDYKMDEFKTELITEVLNQLVPDKMFYVVVSQQFAGKEGNTTEKWYQSEYKKSSIDEETLAEYRAAMHNIPDFLSFPARNEYISTKFDLKRREEKMKELPVLIRDDHCGRLWFLQDNEFKLPKCITRVAIHSPMMSSDPMKAYLSAMYVICVQDATAEETYNPYLAGLSSTFDIQPWGILLRVGGYDEKQGLFARDLITRLVTFVPDERRYEVLKENLCRNLRNFPQTQPYSQSHYYTGLLLSTRQWSKEQLLACATSCGVEQLKSFIKEALNAIHVEALIFGNTTREEALHVFEDVVDRLRSVNNVRFLFPSEIRQDREYELPKGHSYIYNGLQNTHMNAAINFVMQTGLQTVRENALLELVVQLLAEPAFNQLRTKEQLGYIVHTGVRRSNGTQALEILVQGQRDPELMEQRIENFLSEFRMGLEKMPETEFRNNVEALATKRLEKPKTLAAKAARLWSEIDVGFYLFDRDNIEVPVLRALTKEDVLSYFDSNFATGSPGRRKLCAVVYANNETEETLRSRVRRSVSDKGQGCTPIENINSFKAGLSLYPLPQPAVEVTPG